jgi:hypothetical protein
VAILTQPKNAITKQFVKLFDMDDVDLSFEEGALDAIAEQALTRKLGARGLRSMVEQILLEPMFELPSTSAPPAKPSASPARRSRRSWASPPNRSQPPAEARRTLAVPKTLTLPAIPIRDMVLFPGARVPFVVGRSASVRTLELAIKAGDHLLMLTQKDAKVETRARRISTPSAPWPWWNRSSRCPRTTTRWA